MAAKKSIVDVTREAKDSKFTAEALNLVKAGCQAILCSTREPGEVALSLQHVTRRMNETIAARNQGVKKDEQRSPYTFVEWDLVRGFTFEEDNKNIPFDGTLFKDPNVALAELAKPNSAKFQSAIVVMHNLHVIALQSAPFRQNFQNIMVDRMLSNRERRRPIFLVQPTNVLHPDLQQFLQPLPFQPPNEDELTSIVDFVYKSFATGRPGLPDKLDEKLHSGLVMSMKGLYRMQAEDALSLAVAELGGFGDNMVRVLRDQKAKLIGSGGILEYITEEQIPQISEIRGFDDCEPAIRMSAMAYTKAGRASKLDLPKGIALLGVPGAGKSMMAKLTSRIFQDVCGQAFPIYRVNVGAIFNQYLGASEENLDNVLGRLSAHDGCIAVFDEFEKTFGRTESSHEVSNRLRGRLLNWMQDERNGTYVVITMNSTQGVAAEFFRRFDETFFVDLPTTDLRREILEVHFEKRGVALDSLELEDGDWMQICEATNNFVGSELEDVVVRARLFAFQETGDPLPTLDHIMQSITERSRSVIYKSHTEVIDDIREFCKNIARPVTKAKEGSSSGRRAGRGRGVGAA